MQPGDHFLRRQNETFRSLDAEGDEPRIAEICHAEVGDRVGVLLRWVARSSLLSCSAASDRNRESSLLNR
jgi:hypothetical protein